MQEVTAEAWALYKRARDHGLPPGEEQPDNKNATNE
jgi:hypothetical protein